MNLELLNDLNRIASLLPKANVDAAIIDGRNAIGGHFPKGNLPRAAVVAILGRVLAEAMADELLSAHVATSTDQASNISAVREYLIRQFEAAATQRRLVSASEEAGRAALARMGFTH